MRIDADNRLSPSLLEDLLPWGGSAHRLGGAQIANLAVRPGAGDKRRRRVAAEIVHHQDLHIVHIMVQAQVLDREVDAVEILVGRHANRQLEHKLSRVRRAARLWWSSPRSEEHT